jgi:uncharacterized Zn finger protein
MEEYQNSKENLADRINKTLDKIDLSDKSTKPLTETERKNIKELIMATVEEWWAKSWLKAIISDKTLKRMARGLKYYINDQVQDIYISSGVIFALVKGTAMMPYRVKFAFKTFEYSDWKKIYEEIIKRPHIYMQLLENKFPKEIDDISKAKGINFFPTSNLEEYTSCNCPDKENPCKHIAAVAIFVARMLEIDPFQIFVMRGRKREIILEELRSLKAEKMNKNIETVYDPKKHKFSFDVPHIRVGDFSQTRTLHAADKKLDAYFEIEPPKPGYAIIEDLKFYSEVPDLSDFLNTLKNIVDDAANLAYNIGKNIKNTKSFDK